MVHRLPDMSGYHEMYSGIVAAGRARHRPCLVHASSTSLDLAAAQVDQRKPHEKAWKERVLSEIPRPGHRLLSEGDAVIPLSRGHRVFEQNLRGPETQDRRP